MPLRKCTTLAALLTTGIATAQVEKPVGLFSASSGDAEMFAHPECRGVLVRDRWSAIEPSPGNFDFRFISAAAKRIEDNGKDWSLAIGAGSSSPQWLIDDPRVESFTFPFRGVPITEPKGWNDYVQERLEILATALGEEFGTRPRLRLVYISQMTANGIEGHFNGCPDQTLLDAGYTHDLWVEASTATARHFAAAFPSKPLAFEVHDILGSAEPARRILDELWNDPTLDHRVGGAMWWISGKTHYQTDLIQVLHDFEGDIYCQAIQPSTNPAGFLDNDYTTMLDQARTLNVRYIELWEEEFELHTFDTAFEDFNTWADQTFGDNTGGDSWIVW